MKFKFLLIAFLFTAFISLQAQEKKTSKIKEEKIKVNISSAYLNEWFALIEDAGVVLSYNPQLLDMNELIRVKTGSTSVEALLKDILLAYEYKIIPAQDNKIIIQIQGRKSLIFSGVVKEEKSREKLYGASIRLIDQTNKEFFAVTDENGFFSIKIAPNRYQIIIDYIAYKSINKNIIINKSEYNLYYISPISFPLQELIVSPKNRNNELKQVSPSNLLSFSSSDIFSQIQILPGVIGSPAAGNMQVNGGSTDENLILLDGVPIYHSSHISSILPVFNGDAIKSIAFHKSFFPANYEGRLSSVADIKLKDGNKEKFTQTLSLEMPSASAVIEGPIVKNKLSFLLAARRSWLDFFNSLFSQNDNLNHSFYDFNLKLSYDINNNTSLIIGAYKAKDNYFSAVEAKSRKSVLNWNNQAYYTKLSTTLGRVFNSNTLSYTSYSNNVYAPMVGLDKNINIKGGIKELSFTTDYSYNLDNIFTLSGGVKASLDKFNLASVSDILKNRKVNIAQFSFFYNTKVDIGTNLQANIGLNFLAYLPVKQKEYYSIQPRFSIKMLLSKSNILYADFSRMEQFYHYIRVDAFPLPTDFRMPSIDGIKPSTSEHYEAGWKLLMDNVALETSVYYKRRHNIIAFKPSAYASGEAWNKYIMIGNGESYGVKIHYYSNWAKFMLQFSYAFSRSKEWFSFMQERGKMPSLYDIPHLANLAFTYKMNSKSSFSLGGLLSSGRIVQSIDNEQSINYNQFRKFRKGTEYRVDASYTYTKQFDKTDSKLLFRLGLYNLLGNRSEEHTLDFYSVNLKSSCLPYCSVTFKF